MQVMTRPLLTTKLYKPAPRPKTVLRPRLTERLNEGLYRKLTLISAPAGFGKTTLVSEWLVADDRPVAWLSLDESDHDPARFLTYLVTALQTVMLDIGEGALAALQSPQAPTEAVLTLLLNEVASASGSVILVLDDYHLVDAKPVDDALRFLLEHQPPNLHLVITTREDPQLPLPRLRARDQLTELRAADLRFTLEEAADFLNGVMGLSLTAEALAALESRTEGWIVGLQMAALSMRGREDTARFVEAFAGSHAFVLDYLAEEVLQQQPKNVQTFLLQTSMLSRLSGPLCDAVTGQGNSSEVLETLRRANLFIIPLDDKREWYRYHHLFADVLQARLLKTHAPQVPRLHLRASEWYERQGLMSGAIRHALAAEAFERAARLIELTWRKMDVSFQSGTWFAWAKALPDDLIQSRPVLSVGYAWAHLNAGEFEAMEARLHDAERWLDETDARPAPLEPIVHDEHEFQVLPVTIASARAYKAQALGDLPATVEHASKARDLLPEADLLGRAIPNSLLGLAYWASGKLEQAYDSLATGLAGFESSGDLLAAISGAFGLADIRIAQGRLREAATVYERALGLALRDEPPLRGTATLYLGLSELYRERGNEEAAEQYLSKSEAQAKLDVQKVYDYRWCLAKAHVKEAQGDFEGALELLDEAAQHQTQLHVPFIRPAEAQKARVWLKHGELGKAQAWVHEQGLSVNDDLSYRHEFEHMTLVRVLIARYEVDQVDSLINDAKSLLQRLSEAADEGGRAGSVIELLILQSLVYQAQGDNPAALDPLKRALTLARPEGYVQTFVDEGPPMMHLLSEVKTCETLSGYVVSLLATFGPKTQAGEARVPGLPDSSLLEPLSERELEVLRLVAQGLSNREIGKRLYRALDTIKGHNRRIYGKLQVKNRTEAVAKARELGLLQ